MMLDLFRKALEIINPDPAPARVGPIRFGMGTTTPKASQDRAVEPFSLKKP